MRKYFFLLCALLAMQAAQGQIEFGPYLTYSGKDSNCNQITVQIAVAGNDNAQYSVAYWQDDISAFKTAVLSTSKAILPRRNCDNTTQYLIKSVTLTGLTAKATYNYIISSPNGTFTANTVITPNDLNGKHVILLRNASLNGSLKGITGELVLIDNQSTISLSSLAVYSNFKISHYPSKIYQFLAPNCTESTLTCYLVSDTQVDSAKSGVSKDGILFQNIYSRIITEKNPTLLLHGGDFGSYGENMFINFREGKDLFASIPLQITEGNHDTGYWGSYTPAALNTTGTLYMPCVPTEVKDRFASLKYPKEVIWFDKLYHYDFPGLKTTVRDSIVLSQSTCDICYTANINTTVDDYYSFDYGPVHFSVLDYDNYDGRFSKKSPNYAIKQFKWLMDDLASTTKKWKVILTHFSKTSDGPTIAFNYKGLTTSSSKETLDSIIYRNRVGIVIDGHQHWNANWGADDIQISMMPQSEVPNDTTGRSYLLMRVPIDASDSDDPWNLGYFSLFFTNGNFVYNFFDKNNDLNKVSSVYYLNDKHTIKKR